MTKTRSLGIDSMRYLSMACVVLAHTYQERSDWFSFFAESLRFVIPFFFMASGYYMTHKLLQNDSPSVYLKYAWQMLLLYLIWSAVYFLNPPLHAIRELGFLEAYKARWAMFMDKRPGMLFLEGIIIHLWFFASLILTTLFYLIFRTKHIGLMLMFSIPLYVVGVLGQSYADTAIGIHMPINTRLFLFLSALPFALGAYFRSREVRVSDTLALTLLVTGMALSIGEAWFIRSVCGAAVQDYYFSTIIVGTGAFFVAQNGIGFLKNPVLSRLGRSSLGIYAIHVLVILRLEGPGIALFGDHWDKVETVIVLAVSTALVFAMSRVGAFRNLIAGHHRHRRAGGAILPE